MRRNDLFRTPGRLKIAAYGRRGYLTPADAMVFAQDLKNEIAEIVFLDPPFNLGKDYGVASPLETSSAQLYESYMTRLIHEMARVLKPGGALFLYHLPYWASKLSHELHQVLEFRHWIAIAMKNGFVRGRRLYPAHYALLYYTKGQPRRFSRPRLLPQSCRHCGKLVKDYGGYTDIIRRKGINLSDFWDDLSPVRHASRKHRKANQLPLALTDRVVAIAGQAGGVLIDPFVGTGTSLVSAWKAGMFFIGNDLSRYSLKVCVSRLKSGR